MIAIMFLQLLLLPILVIFLPKLGNAMSIRTIHTNEVNIKPIASFPCQESSYFNVDLSLRLKAGNIDMTIVFDETIDNTFTLMLQIDRNVNGIWQKNFYNYNGPFFDTINTHAKKIWKKVMMGIIPPIKDPYKIEDGTYTLNNFHVSTNDVEIPLFLGLYRATFKILKPDGELGLCYNFEGEIQKV